MLLRRVIAISGMALAMAGASPSQADILGRGVTFQVLTYDDPAHPLFEGTVHRARIGDKPEFGLRFEGVQNELDVVPVLVDISADRIEISYASAPPGELWPAVFNGYVLTFDHGCAVIGAARVDRGFTTLPFDNKRLRLEADVLKLNVSGLKYDKTSRIGIELDLIPCPES